MASITVNILTVSPYQYRGYCWRVMSIQRNMVYCRTGFNCVV